MLVELDLTVNHVYLIIIIIHIYIAHYSHCALMRFLKKQLYPY